MDIKNCGRDEGLPFQIAYVFTPKGVKAYAGSWLNIVKATNHLPTCHGVVHYYNKARVNAYMDFLARHPAAAISIFPDIKMNVHLKRGVVRTDWQLFGQHTFQTAKADKHERRSVYPTRTNYFSLIHVEPAKNRPGYYKDDIAIQACLTRKKWVLVWVNAKSEYKAIRSFRRLPSQFLKPLAEVPKN